MTRQRLKNQMLPLPNPFPRRSSLPDPLSLSGCHFALPASMLPLPPAVVSLVITRPLRNSIGWLDFDFDFGIVENRNIRLIPIVAKTGTTVSVICDFSFCWTQTSPSYWCICLILLWLVFLILSGFKRLDSLGVPCPATFVKFHRIQMIIDQPSSFYH